MSGKAPLVARAAIVASVPEAFAACGLLTSEGIRCDYHAMWLQGPAWDDWHPQEILVSEADVERARELLGDIDTVPDEPPAR